MLQEFDMCHKRPGIGAYHVLRISRFNGRPKILNPDTGFNQLNSGLMDKFSFRFSDELWNPTDLKIGI